MKRMKRIVILLLSVAMLVPFVAVQIHAAEGELMFSDPQTKVGENVSVDMVVKSGGVSIGDVDIKMSYDATSLEFISGNEVTNDGNGTLTYSHKGNGSETELRTTLEFRALKQGTTNISVSGHTAYLFSDETLTLVEGTSTITIDVGTDGSTSIEPNAATVTAAETDVKVSVDGTEYSFSEAFKASDIPEGYSETKLMYDGAERKFLENEKGVKLGYLVDGSGKAGFFLYNEENATFSPFVEIYISEETAIVLLNNIEGVDLPEQYQKADLIVGDYTFSAWQDMEHQGYYAIYALNETTGQKEIYQYDTVDGTYQRMIMPVKSEKETTSDNESMIGKIKNIVNDNFTIFFILLLGLLLLLVIVLSVKLYHRNSELDDLYDEYGIDDDSEEEEESIQKVSRKSKKKKEIELDEYEDDAFEDYDDFEVDYDDWDDDFEDDVFEEKPKKSSRKNNSNKKDSDPYNIDFIDL